jgi:hypothetical protein
MNMNERSAILHTEGWGGHQKQFCVVVGETAKRYRVRALHGSELRLPRRGGAVLKVLSSGTYLVPKTAITFEASDGTSDAPITVCDQCDTKSTDWPGLGRPLVEGSSCPRHYLDDDSCDGTMRPEILTGGVRRDAGG